jgi:hypothetical protein
MAEFKLDRFKYRWRGDWSIGEDYKRDDIVRVNGKSYVCLIAHTSSAAFRSDLNAVLPGSSPPQPQPKWVVMTSGRSFLGNWSSGTNYNLGDVVLFQGTLWLCQTSHQSTSFTIDSSYWTVFAAGIDYIGNWQNGISYGPGALVKYNGIVYKCITSHTSFTLLEDSLSAWEIFHEGVEYKGAWTTTTVYRKNDYVKYGGSLWRCTASHTSGTELIDTFSFQIEVPGFQFDGLWDENTYYNTGDIVRNGGFLYYALQPSNNVDPSSDSTTWSLLSKSYNFRGEYSVSQTYDTGDIVQRGGQLYIALLDIGTIANDGSTLDYLEPEYWELLIPGKVQTNGWVAGQTYAVGDVVTYLGTAYVCNLEHEAETNNFPGDNGSGFEYWDVLIQAGQPGGLTTKGDILTYGLTRDGTGDGSTKGDTAVAIGNTNQVLSISEDLELFWRDVISDAEVVYVSPDGVDAEGRGTKYRPMKTVRYACEYVEDTFDPLTPVKVSVATGRYKEVGPIAVPAGCVVMGDELRSTTIEATGPVTEYIGDYEYVQAYINYFETIIFDIFNNVPVTNGYTGGVGQDFSNPNSTQAAIDKILDLFQDWKNYVEFRISDGTINPTVTGSNTPNSDTDETSAIPILLANRNFIADEIIGFLADDYPSVTFDSQRVRNDVLNLLRGLRGDLAFSGNYRTIQSARRYSNSVTGSKRDDLFYMRDTTGLRNLTTEGLQGDLNPPGVFDLYQRPTGGSCASLDPGWGPDDERVWINNRSPYLQGVTNIGTACIGQKIDGALHNGGNRSMVSNDFTQVLSDGIGAWVLNNARAELVSVFTYYCQVGYLAEDGGIIRATNGNNSYGSWGSIADGNDDTETPQTVTVNNQNNEAQVSTAFAGGNNDRIFTFEYTNCGQDYTTATAEIVGAGANASVEYPHFRNGGLFEARLINTQGSGTEGGSGYSIYQGSAQVTVDSTSTIRLSANEDVEEADILGMRVLIVSGQGAGQYGYISALNIVTKDVTVRRETDNELGWNHVVPGTEIRTSLDSTAVYRIEPRVVANHPGFASSSLNLPSPSTFVDVAFGGTTQEFPNKVGNVGTGETFDATAIPARFDITRRGTVYDVLLDIPGAGYAVGDIITFEGAELGGVTPDNNLTITVTSVSDDSTNSIITFTTSGVGREGRYVSLSNTGAIQYSDDGETWSTSSTSFTGDFVKLLAADNKFIAIATDENRLSFSFDGETWLTRSLPATANWIDAAYGNGVWVVIAEDSNTAARSLNGLSWSSTSLPTGDDSTGDQWVKITHGQGRFVVITGSSTKDVAYSSNGSTWSRYNNVLPAGNYDWVAFAYGDNRFLALAEDGSTALSIDKGETWTNGSSAPSIDGSTAMVWKDMKFEQGIFFAICDTGGKVIGADLTIGPTDFVATTEDGVYWKEQTLSSSGDWSALTHSTIDNVGAWLLLSDNATSNGSNKVLTGKQAKLRADVFQGKFQSIKIWDCGSGYSVTNPVVITVTDPNFVTEIETDNRIGNGVLPQPSYIDRGTGYRTSTSTISILGDGFADIIPESNILVLDGVSTLPSVGVQIRIASIPDEDSEDPNDLKLFTGVGILDLGDDGSGNGTRTVQFTLSPSLKNEYNLSHNTSATLRERYSQCRITGHDFLDIGTGNFEETNYPDIYAGGAFFVAAPENEVLEINGGRVFYTATDQDGNFRTGELFSVQQSTGIVTISAEFFDLDGLSELSLGGVRLGGSGTVVREFSTDPTFAEDSNNVVPTQRAIATFLANRLSVGGENLETNNIIAGTVSVGSQDNIISVGGGAYLNIPVDVSFDGTDENGNLTGIQGTIISQMMFLRNENDSMQ